MLKITHGEIAAICLADTPPSRQLLGGGILIPKEDQYLIRL
jgi:hypothetical protein